MIYTPMTKKALKLCFEAHKEQTDKSGLPYVFHPFHLAEPKTLELPDADIDTLTDLIWTNLNEDNKVSLFTRFINIADGTYESRIVNKNR